ncbi:MAG: histidine kinase [bacterium]|nr:histidine kinase [bacterium]
MAIYTYVLFDFAVPFKIALVDSFITHLSFTFSAFLIHITLKYYQPTKENIFYMRIWALLMAIGNTAVIVKGLEFLYSQDLAYQEFISKSVLLRFIYQVLMMMIITVIQWMANFLTEQKSLAEHQHENERIVKEAELYNLRQQLQPHFLFNSLNSISALAGSKPDQARRMIEQLSEFLRHTLRKDDKQLISLKEELYQLDLYLQIEKVRFGNRLKSTVVLDASCANKVMPALILQPLVENAIKFGLYDTLGEVEIVVEAKCAANQYLQIQISNPFDSLTHRQTAGTGFGLDSIKRRLYLLYANNDLVQTEIKDQQFIVRLTIPQ